MKVLPINVVMVWSLVRLSGAPTVPWGSPAFSIPPGDVAAAAAQVQSSEKDDAVVLYEEDPFSFDAAGAAMQAGHSNDPWSS